MNDRPEYERRWLVPEIDRSILGALPSVHIHQVYPGTPTGMRIRVTDSGSDITAEMMVKTGRGISRMERPAEMNLAAARLALNVTPFSTRKQRFFLDGWEINIYLDKLEGLILVEREMTSPDCVIEFPPWMGGAVEVTDTVCDEFLAKLAYDFDVSPGADALREMLTRRPLRIVLTGGPYSGKSAAIRQIATEFSGVFQAIPEVASLVVKELGVSPPTDDRAALRRYNRAFGEIQRALETVALHQALRDGKPAVIMDRGTMDNAPYLPGGKVELERVYMSTAAAEFARYDLVVFIRMPERQVYEHHRADNPARLETYSFAAWLEHRTGIAWKGHPNVIVVPDFPTWEEKYAAIRREVMKLVVFP